MLKCILAGLFAALVATGLTGVILFALVFWTTSNPDLTFEVANVHALPAASLALSAFALGFYWQWRRGR
jgi:hypothetical protein